MTDNTGQDDGIRRPRMLSAAFVKTISRAGRFGDGRGGLGLSLLVKGTRTGRWSKTWSQRLRISGVAFNLGLGRFPVVMLSEARALALENARAVQQGRDPRGGGVPTFAEAVDIVINTYEPTWKNPKTAKNMRAALREYAFPTIGRLRVSNITTAHILAVLVPIWNDKPSMARALRSRIGMVLKWAVAAGYREDNPAGDSIAAALPKGNGAKGHMKALPHDEVGAALKTIRASKVWIGAKLALEFLVLTAARSGEVRGMTWAEVDVEHRVWTIPATRMKSKREHRVPLCQRVIDILREAQPFGDGAPNGIVFTSMTGKAISDNGLSRVLRDLQIAGVVHGFRSSFRDWAGDSGRHPREVAEQALAHAIPNQVEAAYARSDLFERRRTVMDEWAAYLFPQSQKSKSR